MQRKIFFPAISLLNRLNYTKKFTLLWVLSLISVWVVVYSLYTNLDRIIQPAVQRLEGIALIEPISRGIQALQLHRGLSTAVLGGNAPLREQRDSQKAVVSAALKVMEEKLPPALIATEDFRHIMVEWARLREAGPEWSVAGNLVAHNHLIEHVQTLEQRAVEEHLLVMDTDVAAYYLSDIATSRLMAVLEHLGRLRDHGTAALNRKQLDEDQRLELRLIMAELDDALRHLSFGIDSVNRHNSSIQGVLQGVFRDVDASVGIITGLVNTDILSNRFATPPEVLLQAATEQIDRSYAQLYDTLLPMAARLTQAHIDRAKKEMASSIGISLLVFLLVVYLSVSIYYAIVGSIQMLVHSLHRFAEGDLNVRVALGTEDELSQVGHSFNEMAHQFSALMGVHRENEDRLRATIETAMDGVVRMDERGIITGWNKQAEKIFGWSREEAIGRVLGDTIIPPRYRQAYAEGLQRFLLTGEGEILNTRSEMTGLHRNGHEFPVELSVAPIRLGEAGTGRYEFSAFIRDITEQKASGELIWNQANFDSLTGLPNRRMFMDRLTQDVRKAHRAGLKAALLFIDLDKFKEVNDTLGHSKGDIMLREAAQRISLCVREADTVARLGGDEFTVILAGLADAGSIDRVAEQILQNLARPFQLGDEIAYVSASIGITLYPDDASEIEDMLKNADQAMYAAKNRGRNRFDYFKPAMQQAAQERLQLTNELRGALQAGQLRVYYQPIMELGSGRITKAEALIRWQHPLRGLISPALFIPLAEETGLIVEIGDWVFREAARQAKHWQALYHPAFQLSVNVSPVQFGGAIGSAMDEWADYLRELDFGGQGIVVEITEGLLLEADTAVADKLRVLRDAGMKVAIDDFGTGYSSLSYLKKFEIDYLKIDRSFVRDLVTDADELVLSEAIIVMAHKLGLKVIAEGVETVEQCKLLHTAGCDYAQGYLISQPVPAEEFEALMKNGEPVINFVFEA